MPAKKTRRQVKGSKLIRVDSEVLKVLAGLAEPLVDTPNSVLRRVLGLT